jgi:hypothetical protein
MHMTEPRDDMTTEEASLLYELQRLWEGRYDIRVLDDGSWTAQRVTGAVGLLLSAHTGHELRPLIAADAIAWNHEQYARGAE